MKGIIVLWIQAPGVHKVSLGTYLFDKRDFEFYGEWISNLTPRSAEEKLDTGISLCFATTPRRARLLQRTKLFKKWLRCYEIKKLIYKECNYIPYDDPLIIPCGTATSEES